MNIQKMMDPQMLKQMQQQMPSLSDSGINPATAQAAVEDLKDQFDMD